MSNMTGNVTNYFENMNNLCLIRSSLQSCLNRRVHLQRHSNRVIRQSIVRRSHERKMFLIFFIYFSDNQENQVESPINDISEDLRLLTEQRIPDLCILDDEPMEFRNSLIYIIIQRDSNRRFSFRNKILLYNK